MSESHFSEIKGKIVSQDEGEKREELKKHIKLEEIAAEKKAPIGIASKDPADDKEEYLKWLSTNAGFIEGLTKTTQGGVLKETLLNDIQRTLINPQISPKTGRNYFEFLWIEKCRQLGFSFDVSAKGLAECMLLNKHTSIFVSYNEEESKEKIIFARELYESLPMKWQLGRRLKLNNKTSLVFEKTGQDSSETRILSYPQRIIRGKGDCVHVVIDEAAHCIHFKKIYTSALPVLSRGGGSLWVGSTPAGKGGLFYDIKVNQDDNYSTFTRVSVKWWMIPEFCKDVVKAKAEAPFMITDERVAKFATDMLKAIRRSGPLDDFQQEYECAYLDESYAYYPWDLINSCVPIINVEAEGDTDYDDPSDYLSANDKSKAGSGIDYFSCTGSKTYEEVFDEFCKAIDSGLIKGQLLVGYDVGRNIDVSEVTFVEEIEKDHIQIPRCNLTYKNMRLPDQRAFTMKCIDKLHNKIIKVGIDNTGIGSTIAEDLENVYPELLVKIDFSNTWKEEAARRMKFRMEVKKIVLPTNRSLLGQIHSIKKILLPISNLWRFDTEKNEKHHGDKFWSLVIASEMGYPIMSNEDSVQEFDKRIFGSKNETEKKRYHEDIAIPTVETAMRFSPYGNIPNFSSVYGNLKPPSIPFNDLPSFGKRSGNSPHII